MAKSRTVTRTVVARAPSPTIRVVAPAPVRARVKHHARRAGRAAWGERNLLIPLGASYLLGLAKKNGTAIPKILGMGPAASAAIICWAIGKWGKSPLASSAAVGLGSVALYSVGAGEGVAGEGRAVLFDEG